MHLIRYLRENHERFLRAIESLDDEVLGVENKYYAKEWPDEISLKVHRVLAGLVPRVRRHEEIERRFLFPLVTRWVPRARESLREMESEHAELNRLLERFAEELDHKEDKPSRWMVLNLLRLTRLLRDHLHEEEHGLLAEAERKVPAEFLEISKTEDEFEREFTDVGGGD